MLDVFWQLLSLSCMQGILESQWGISVAYAEGKEHHDRLSNKVLYNRASHLMYTYIYILG